MSDSTGSKRIEQAGLPTSKRALLPSRRQVSTCCRHRNTLHQSSPSRLEPCTLDLRHNIPWLPRCNQDRHIPSLLHTGHRHISLLLSDNRPIPISPLPMGRRHTNNLLMYHIPDSAPMARHPTRLRLGPISVPIPVNRNIILTPERHPPQQ
jgi:hypothetical protein